MKLSELNPNQYQQIEPPKTGLASGIGNFAKGIGVGALKAVGETTLGAGQLGRSVQKMLPSWMSTIPGSTGENIFDPNQAQQLRDTVLSANAPGQGTGKFLGTAAQYLLPTSSITRGQQILGAAASKVPTTLGRMTAQGAARFLPEAVGTGAVSFVRSGGDVEQAKQEGMLAGGFSVGLGALGGLARATYWPVLDDSVNKALGVQGKKSGGVALNQTAQKTSGLQVLKDRAKELTVKLDDGSTAPFDPATATYNTTLQAWKSAKEKIFNEYTSLASKAGDTATLDLSGLRQQIANSLDAPILSVEKNAVRSVLKDFDVIFQNPNAVDLQTAERFVKSLNENTVQGFFTGTSDAASSKVFAGTARLIREQLDEAITENTGQGYQALRSQYAALKSIEDDLVRRFQQDARQIGGGLPEYTGAFASGDIIGSALSLDPAQFAKGATLGVFSALKRKLSNPERFLRRSFDLIDDVPSDLYLRIFGGQSSLDDAGKNMADDIASSIKNPGMGLSIKSSVTPEDVAKSLTDDQIDMLRLYMKNPADKDLFPKAHKLFDKIGIGQADDTTQIRFVKEIFDEFDRLTDDSLSSFNSAQ